MKKTIGTAIPLRSLRSRAPELASEAHGTFRTVHPLLEWLKATGQRVWQTLPLSQTHLETGSTTAHVPSPYKGYGVGLDPAFLAGMPEDEPDDVAIENFLLEHAAWLPAYALFCAIRDDAGSDRWWEWPAALRDRDGKALAAWRETHAAEVRRHEVLQWRAHRAFSAIRAKANATGIHIVGDLPFYVPHASPLVWTHRECFDLGEAGQPALVSGIPNSARAFYGRQVWGHPLYRWQVGEARQPALEVWRLRLSYHAGQYDMMRLDHAKGLFRYGAVDPADSANDTLMEGPGAAALDAIAAHAQSVGLALFAEDSGDWLDDLRSELRRLGVPGMRVLRFAFNERTKHTEKTYADVAHYPEHSVAFTSTHDTSPLREYVTRLDEAELRALCDEVGVAYGGGPAETAARLRDAVLESPAQTCIVPVQDWLLTTDRINVPGTEVPVNDPNWRWRMTVAIEDLPSDLRRAGVE